MSLTSAIKVFKDATNVSGLIHVLDKVIAGSSTSLPDFIKPSLLTFPTFTSKDIVNLEIYKNTNQILFNMSSAMVMIALNLDTYISKDVTLRDIVSRVSSESSSYLELEDAIKKFKISNESAEEKYNKLVKIIYGSIISVKMNIPGTNKPLDIKLYVQLLTRIVNNSFFNSFFTAFNKNKKFRFIQYEANEISFWKDLVFQQDLIKDKMRLLKYNDEIVTSIVNKSHQTFVRKFISLFSKSRKTTTNVRNNIYIVLENEFNKICKSIGMNPKNKKDIDRVLYNTYGMILVLVNPIYNLIKINIYGLEYPITYTFDEIQKQSFENNKIVDFFQNLGRR